jgi:hypothetical protein
MLSRSNPFSMVFDRKMLNQQSQIGFFYPNTMESYLSTIMRNHGTRNITEEKPEWQNVPNVQPTFQNQRRLGKWQEDQTNKANECNWKSHFTTVPKVTALSEKS